MPKREAELKSLFRRALIKRLPTFQMLQYSTVGAPDRSILGYGVQTNWEAKHGTPDFESPGNQELVCMRLAAASHCRYIIWQESADGVGQRTMIVHPIKVKFRNGWTLEPETFCIGYDMKWLVEQVMKAHRVF